MFCKVPSVSAVWLFYVVIKAVLGTWGRSEGWVCIYTGCLLPVLQSSMTNTGNGLEGLQGSYSSTKGHIAFNIPGDSVPTSSPRCE